MFRLDSSPATGVRYDIWPPLSMNNDSSAGDGGVSDSSPSAGTDQFRVVPILAEQMEITKLSEDVGAVRIRKATKHDESLVQTSGTLEVVETTRVPINLPVDAAQPARYRGDVWVVPIYEERLVKQLFLVEELHVSKRVERVPHEEKLTLRREELVTERFDPVTQKWVIEPTDSAMPEAPSGKSV